MMPCSVHVSHVLSQFNSLESFALSLSHCTCTVKSLFSAVLNLAQSFTAGRQSVVEISKRLPLFSAWNLLLL